MNSSGDPFSLAGKRILVTGASSGLGLATALACARMGAEVIASGRDATRLGQTLECLRAISPRAHRLAVADLTQADQRHALVAELEQGLQGVVHSAGISRLCPVRQISAEHLQSLYAINVEAPVLLTRELLRQGRLSDESSIVFIASIAARIGVAGVAGYSATKAALIAMARCLAMEVAHRRMRVNCLAPALVETPLVQAARTTVSTFDKHLQGYPLGIGQPDDVAHAALYLLAEASRWVTGTTLVLDGGLTIS
jgi:NAD(P)-dependent dehydrogenase (short-subunit alcohol dehydrogenase family)